MYIEQDNKNAFENAKCPRMLQNFMTNRNHQNDTILDNIVNFSDAIGKC